MEKSIYQNPRSPPQTACCFMEGGGAEGSAKLLLAQQKTVSGCVFMGAEGQAAMGTGREGVTEMRGWISLGQGFPLLPGWPRHQQKGSS